MGKKNQLSDPPMQKICKGITSEENYNVIDMSMMNLINVKKMACHMICASTMRGYPHSFL